MQRSRSDSSPVRSSAATELAQGNAHLTRRSRWNSWSAFPLSHGIPLGSLTAKEAAKPFWNTEMLQQRLDKIAEYAALEATPSLDGDVEIEDLDNPIPLALEVEEHSDEVFDDDSDSDDGSASPVLTRNPAARTRDSADLGDSGKEMVEQLHNESQIARNLKSKNGPLAVRSAPALTERDTEPFPIAAILSRSTHVL